MTNLYVRSTTGNNGNSGLSWALAKADITGAAGIDAAGDVIFVSQAHAESTAGAISPVLNGTATTAPVQVLCADDSAEPPVTLAATATIFTTGNTSISPTGCSYWYGISFRAGNSTGSANIGLATQDQRDMIFENCNFTLGSTDASNVLIGTASLGAAEITWKNCNLKFSGVLQNMQLRHRFVWRGGAMIAGTSTPSLAVFVRPTMVNAAGGDALIEGVDLSALSSSVTLCSFTSDGRIVLRNCKLPASWSGVLAAITSITGGRAEMWNCSDGDTNYAMRIQTFAGQINADNAVFRNGGASDGVTPISWRMASTTVAFYPMRRLIAPEIFVHNADVGSPITLTVQILHDSITPLTDAEISLEVEYLGTSGVPLALFTSNMAVPLATPANHAASAETWTNAMSNPNAQELSVTVTPQEAGVLICRVMLHKVSYTVYVDPVVTVS